MARKAKAVNDKTQKIEDATVSVDEVEAANQRQKQLESKRDTEFNSGMMYGKGAYKRSLSATMQERDMGRARLHDLYHNRDVEMFWDVSPEMTAKQLFRLDIKTKQGTVQLVLSAVELQKYLRWV